MGEVRRTIPIASLSTVSLGDLDFRSLLGAFGGASSIFVTLSLPIRAWREVLSMAFRISDAVGPFSEGG